MQLERVVLVFILRSDTPRDTARSLRITTELGAVGALLGRPLDGKAEVSQSEGWNALPVALRCVLERCLRSEPAQRYRNADELMTELERL